MNNIQYLNLPHIFNSDCPNNRSVDLIFYDLEAEEGKVYKSLVLNTIVGKYVTFREYRWLNNVKLDKPYLETEKDFELIEIDDNIIL